MIHSLAELKDKVKCIASDEAEKLASVAGFVAVRGTDDSDFSYLSGKEIFQPDTGHILRYLEVNPEKYHWIGHSEFSWFVGEALPVIYGLFLKKHLEHLVCFEGSEPYLFFLPKDKYLISSGCEVGTLGGSPPYLGNPIYEKEYRSISPYWTPPPLKDFYKDKIKFNFTKPLLIINNKLTDEWSGRPINCFHSNELERLLQILDNKYAIGYIRALGNENGFCNDGSVMEKSNDFEIVRNNCSELVLIQDLMHDLRINFNLAQCLMHAQSDLHISSAGGNAILASYFGGKNIMIGRGQYFNDRKVWAEDSWLKNLSGSKMLHLDLGPNNNWEEKIKDLL